MRLKRLLSCLILIVLLLSFYLKAEKHAIYNINVDFREEIYQNDLQLTIYYMPVTILSVTAMTVDSLINGAYYFKVVVNTPGLEQNYDLLQKINTIKLKSLNDKRRFDVRVYCEFESKCNRQIVPTY